MQIELTPEQDDVVRHAIAAGRIARPEEAVAQAMADGVERERVAFVGSLDEADAEYERGETIRVNTEEQRRALVDDIVKRSQARLASRSHARDRCLSASLDAPKPISTRSQTASERSRGARCLASLARCHHGSIRRPRREAARRPDPGP